MQKIILDTNFILSCLRQKIDFIDQLETIGQITIPKEVVDELNKIKENKKQSKKNRDLATLALKILEKNKFKLRSVELGDADVDKGILNYIKNNRAIIASLDRELKTKLKGKARIMVIKRKKKIEVV